MRLEFDAAAHRYLLNGRPVPSVTQALDDLLDLWKVPADVLEAARVFGDHVHQAVHLLNLERLDEASLDEALRPPVTGWKNFCHDTGFVVLESEFRVGHERVGYAGTLDASGILPASGKRREVRALVDVKSGVVPITVGPQTAAYEEARRSMGLDHCRRRFCVQLHSEAPPFYRITELTDPSDFSLFLSALNVRRFKEKHHVRS